MHFRTRLCSTGLLIPPSYPDTSDPSRVSSPSLPIDRTACDPCRRSSPHRGGPGRRHTRPTSGPTLDPSVPVFTSVRLGVHRSLWSEFPVLSDSSTTVPVQTRTTQRRPRIGPTVLSLRVGPGHVPKPGPSSPLQFTHRAPMHVPEATHRHRPGEGSWSGRH